MKYTIETMNDNGSGMTYKTKEEFMKEIGLMIDDCIANGGTFFDVQVDSDASCFYWDNYKLINIINSLTYRTNTGRKDKSWLRITLMDGD